MTSIRDTCDRWPELVDRLVTLRSVEVGLGCVNLGSASAAQTESAQVRLVRAAIDEGVTVFDTADVYGAGASERVLGRALRHRRDGLTIATKGGYVFRPRRPLEQRMRRAVARVLRSETMSPSHLAPSESRSGYSEQDFSQFNLRRAVEGSLRRLGVDHIDVYQLHGPREYVDGLLASLDDLSTNGMIGRFGVGAESIDTAIRWSSDPRVEVVQVPFGVLDPNAREILLPRAVASGAEVWARGVLGGGLISAAIKDPTTTAAHPKAALIGAISRIASEAGMTMDELAIRWVAAHPAVRVVLLGMSSIDHLRRNTELLRLPPLEPDVLHGISNAAGLFVDGDQS